MSAPLSTPEVSEMTGISESTLRYWRQTGDGPRSWKLGRRAVYDLADVEEWLAAQKAATSRGGAA